MDPSMSNTSGASGGAGPAKTTTTTATTTTAISASLSSISSPPPTTSASTSLDRAKTTPAAVRLYPPASPGNSMGPASSLEEGDQTLREYRLRKAAREDARRRHRAVLGDGHPSDMDTANMDTANDSNVNAPSPSLSGSHRMPVMPPSPSLYHRRDSGTHSQDAPRPDTPQDRVLPAATTDDGTSNSRRSSIASRARSHTQVEQTAQARPPSREGPSPRTSLRSSTGSSSSKSKGDNASPKPFRTSSLIASLRNGLAGHRSASASSLRSSHASAPPQLENDGSSVLREGQYDGENEGDMTVRGVVGIASSDEDDGGSEMHAQAEDTAHTPVAEKAPNDGHPRQISHPASIPPPSPSVASTDLSALQHQSAALLDAELRARRIGPIGAGGGAASDAPTSRQQQRHALLEQQEDDTSGYGIPKVVFVDGRLVDITGLDILEQVEMMRVADRQKREARERARQAHQQQQQDNIAQNRADGPSSPGASERDKMDVLAEMKYTELSDIAERTECGTTVSYLSQRTSSIGPSDSASIACGRARQRRAAQQPAEPASPTQSLLSVAPSLRASSSHNGRDGFPFPRSQPVTAQHSMEPISISSPVVSLQATFTEGGGSSVHAPSSAQGQSIGPPSSYTAPRKVASVSATRFHSSSNGSLQSAASAKTHQSQASTAPPQQDHQQRVFAQPSRRPGYASASEISYSSSRSERREAARQQHVAGAQPNTMPTLTSASAVSSRSTSPFKDRQKQQHGRGVHPLSAAYQYSHGRSGSGLSEASADAGKEGVASQPRADSPTKRALSPVVASRLAQFSAPASGQATATQSLSASSSASSLLSSSSDGSAGSEAVRGRPPRSMAASSSLIRMRAKSFTQEEAHSADARRALEKADATAAFSQLVDNGRAALPASRSTGALVQLYEQRSASPVKGGERPLSPHVASAATHLAPVSDWLQRVSHSETLSASASVSSPPRSVLGSAYQKRLSSSQGGEGLPAPKHSASSPSSSLSLSPSSSLDVGRGHAKTASSPGHREADDMQSSVTSHLRYATEPAQLAPSVHTRHASSSSASFDDNAVVYHSELFWLNSSSPTRPPFWQLTRAVLTQSDELRISWPGASAGRLHERNYDLTKCMSATSVRRNPYLHVVTRGAEDDPDSVAATQGEVEKLQSFELVWPGRAQRFATLSMPARMKWLGCIFTVLSRYTHMGDTDEESAAGTGGDKTVLVAPTPSSVGSATLKSLDVPILQVAASANDDSPLSASPLATPSIADTAEFLAQPRRQLEKEAQESLYASVSDMLSPGASLARPLEQDAAPASGLSSRSDMTTTEIPRYQLSDAPVPPSTRSSARKAAHTPLPSLPPLAQRGAWSDIDRASVQSDGVLLDNPPSRNVARDMKRLLSMMERHGSKHMSRSDDFPRHMQSMRSQLESISAQLRTPSSNSRTHLKTDQSGMADKVDAMMRLLQRMADEKQQQQTAGDAPPALPEKSAPASRKPSTKKEQTALEDQRAADLQRIEAQLALLLEKVEASSSPVATVNNSPEASKSALTGHNKHVTAGTPRQQPPPPFYLGAAGLPQMMPFQPATPSITSTFGDEIDLDAIQWAKGGKRTTFAGAADGAVPTLPPKSSGSGKQRCSVQVDAVRASVVSVVESSEVSSRHVRHERNEAAMRLEGSHPDVVYRLDGGTFEKGGTTSSRQASKKQVGSHWSPDTSQVAQSRMPSSKAALGSQSQKPPPSTAGSRRIVPPTIEVQRSTSKGSLDDAPPTPTQRDYRQPAPALQDPAVQNLVIQMGTMQELLQTLIGFQSKHDEALKHQQQVSDYVQLLHEYLSNDRDLRKEEFKTVKDALSGMSDQISTLPKEIQTLIEASLAINAAQQSHLPAPPRPPSAASSNPDPAPDTDGQPAPHVQIQAPSGKAAKAKAGPISGSQNKAGGSSLLRKVSLGLAGGNAIRVGGPRKMGGPRMFGLQPSTTDEARNRWNRGNATPAGAPGHDGSRPVEDQAIHPDDPQAPLMAALQGFEEQLAAAEHDDDEGGQNDNTSLIAMGIMEILKMLRSRQAKDEETAQQKALRQAEKQAIAAERHAVELDAIRMEIREWETKREALLMANKDPQNQEGIDTIIALLKDQMGAQERLLVDMKESVTPKLANLDEDAKVAMHDMKEHMLDNLDAFREKMDSEVKKTLEEVATLREQKKQLQSDLSDLLAFKSKYGGGAPEGVQRGPAAPARAPAAGYPAPNSDPHAPPLPHQAFPRAMRGPR